MYAVGVVKMYDLGHTAIFACGKVLSQPKCLCGWDDDDLRFHVTVNVL